MPIIKERCHIVRHDVVQVAQAIEIIVQHADRCSKAGGNSGGLCSNDSTSEHGNMRGLHAWDATQQYTPTFLRSLEILRTLLDTHPPRHFAHRSKKAQVTPLVLQRFVRNRRCA